MPILSSTIVPRFVMESYIQWFLWHCDQNTLNRFRYFKNGTDEIRNHVVTLLQVDMQGSPIAYGHLDKDPDNGKIWLGLAVVTSKQHMGYGASMLRKLLERADWGNYTISLSCDKNNGVAFNLYKKAGFKVTEEGPHNFFMEKVFDRASKSE